MYKRWWRRSKAIFQKLYCNSEELHSKYCDFPVQYIDCNFTLRFGTKLPLKYCEITNIFNSGVINRSKLMLLHGKLYIKHINNV